MDELKLAYYRVLHVSLWGALATLLIILLVALRPAPDTASSTGEDGGTTTPAASQLTALAEAGKRVFRNNCAQCHAQNMRTDLTGPALAGVRERWSAYPPEDLYRWIRNSQAMIEAGHPRAVLLWDDWGNTTMNAFPNLSDTEIEQVLAYIEAF